MADDQIRPRLPKHLEPFIENLKQLKLEDLQDFFNITSTQTNGYDNPKVLSAWNTDGTLMDIDSYCEFYRLDRNDVGSYKLVTHTGTPYYNIAFKSQSNEVYITEEFIEECIKKHAKAKQYKCSPIETPTHDFDRGIYTDTHIGMTPNKNGYSLYGGKWDEDEIMESNKVMLDYFINNRTSEVIYVDDLGDLEDGYDGKTVRKGHDLPQNMDNEKAFDVGLEFKIMQADMLSQKFKNVVFNNICNDNHSGSFGYSVNSAFKKYAERVYPNVKVFNHRKFINHYFVGKHAFVISHGKDAHNLKFGFKPVLDQKQIEKIDQYLKANNIYKVADFIEFSKGDSHQMIFDYATSDDFDYMNYGALSPSSEWVQTNFKKGKRMFAMQNCRFNERERNVKYKIFNWKE